MAGRYEKLKPPRFIVERVDGVERIRIRAPRNWLILPFMSVWLVIWTVGGVAAIGELLRTFNLFLLVWLGAWVAGWLFAFAMIAWNLAGAELLTVIGGDLEIAHRIPGFSRRRLYRGADLRRLSTSATPAIFGQMLGFSPPFLTWHKAGSVKFTYGARTVYAANGLDDAEAEMIVDHLRRRLPAGASNA